MASDRDAELRPIPLRAGSAPSHNRPMSAITSLKVLLGVTGGIAAYKCLELVRRLRERGARVRCILTAAGAAFVTPLSLEALSEDQVHSDLFTLGRESEMGHIQLSRDADLLVVAPATADILARMAAGIANDLATTALLATDKPVLAAPAMNVRMWEHPATQANLATLRTRGLATVEAGAQGEHKLARGYLPVTTQSLHWIANPGFRRAVAEFLTAERAAVAEEIEILTSYGPFRRAATPEEEEIAP